MTPERLGLLWGITVFAGACARLFSSFTGFPSVVILLLSGLFKLIGFLNPNVLIISNFLLLLLVFGPALLVTIIVVCKKFSNS